MRTPTFLIAGLALCAATFAVARAVNNDYLFFAGYTLLQYVVLATGWNILGGYAGYVNFGAAAFFGIGAYTSVVVLKLVPAPLPIMILVSGVVAGLIGLLMGYLTLRLRGAFFAIGTLALAVVLQTLFINWDFVGGARGVYMIKPASIDFAGISLPYIQYLFLLMGILAVAAVTAARLIERSRLGVGFATIRDDEVAAEACGVPTMRLKLVATALSGALMGMAGAPFPYYIGYMQPVSTFGLEFSINAIAMPMIGGTTSWAGPVIGALLLGTLQQVATVTISSVANLLIVGVLLTGFVIVAPNGILGLLEKIGLRKADAGKRRLLKEEQ